MEHLEEMLEYAVDDIQSSIPMKIPITTRHKLQAWLGRFWSMGNSAGKEAMIDYFAQQEKAKN